MGMRSANPGFSHVNHGSADRTFFPSINTQGTTYEVLSDFLSAGVVGGFLVTDGGGGTVNVAFGEGLIRVAATSTSALKYIHVAATSGLVIPLDTSKVIVVNYNAGNPIVEVEDTIPTQFYTKLYLAQVHNTAGVIQIHDDRRMVGDIINRLQMWLSGLVGTRVESGEIVYDPISPSRKIGVSAGTYWDGFLLQRTTPALNTNTGDTFYLCYKDGAGDWVITSGNVNWPNTQYDNGTGVLATLGNNKWGVLWVLREYDDGIHVQYGEAEYANQAAAEAAEAPTTRPDRLIRHGFYIAKIVFEKNAVTYGSLFDIRPVIGGGSAVQSSVVLSSLDTSTKAAGEDLVVGDPVYVAANLFYKADNVTNTKVIGIVTTAALTGFSATVTLAGKITLAGLTDATPYFLGNKVITSTVPVSGKIIRLGISISTTEFILNIEEPILLA